MIATARNSASRRRRTRSRSNSSTTKSGATTAVDPMVVIVHMT